MALKAIQADFMPSAVKRCSASVNQYLGVPMLRPAGPRIIHTGEQNGKGRDVGT